MEKLEFKERLVIVKHLGAIAIVAFLVTQHITVLIGMHSDALVYFVLQLLLPAVIGAATLVLYSIKGLVRADRSGVNIKILLFGIPLSERSYEYGDIKRVSCTVEKHNNKNLKYYDMVFVFMLAGGKELCFSKRLKIRFNLEIKDASAYCAAISSEPMMQLYDFVMMNRKRIFDEKHPQ